MIIHHRTCSYLTLLFGLSIGSLGHSFDVCNPADVKKIVDEEKEKSAYKSCELQELSATYFTASDELIDAFSLLKGTYLNSLTQLQNKSGRHAAGSDYDKVLQSAKVVCQESNELEIEELILSPDSALIQLKKRVSRVHRHLQGPHSKISNIKKEFISNNEMIIVCQAHFYWKKSASLRKRIIFCIGEALNQEDDDNSSE